MFLHALHFFFKFAGQLSDASVCYDKIIIQEPDEVIHRQGLLALRLSLGELNSAMDLCNGIIAEK